MMSSVTSPKAKYFIPLIDPATLVGNEMVKRNKKIRELTLNLCEAKLELIGPSRNADIIDSYKQCFLDECIIDDRLIKVLDNPKEFIEEHLKSFSKNLLRNANKKKMSLVDYILYKREGLFTTYIQTVCELLDGVMIDMINDLIKSEIKPRASKTSKIKVIPFQKSNESIKNPTFSGSKNKNMDQDLNKKLKHLKSIGSLSSDGSYTTPEDKSDTSENSLNQLVHDFIN